MTKKVLARDVTELQVPSFSGVMPDDLSKMKVRELQAECENSGIQCSGNRGELLDRLTKLFQGRMVLKKGCTTKFIRLVEMTKSTAAGSDEPLVLPKAKSRPEKMVVPEPKHGSSPPTSGQFEDVSTFQKLSDERIFRRNLDSRLAASSLVQSETPQKDPRTGMGVPSGLEVGRVTPLVRCPLCTADMVLRRNRADGGLFFGCSQFGQGRCKGTRKFDEIAVPQPAGGASAGSQQ